MKRLLIAAAVLTGIGAFVAWELGWLGPLGHAQSEHAAGNLKDEAQSAPPTVSVVAPSMRHLEARVVVTGTLVARTEILVAPEVEGLRVLGLDTDIGDKVEAGQVLARLERETLDVQLAQREAAIARAKAAISQSKSAIAQSEARRREAANALERGEQLKRTGFLSDSLLDQRQATAQTADAALVSARDGLVVAEAELALAEAQRRDIAWRLEKTLIRAPAAGVVSQRNARIGALAAGAAEPMFRIIAGGEIELEAEVPEVDLARLAAGQTAMIGAPGIEPIKGHVRLVSPEVDRASRLGRVRIALGDSPALRIGSFARGSIVTGRSRGLALPNSAVQFGEAGSSVQVVEDDHVKTRAVKTGLASGDWIEVREGLKDTDSVVAKAGTFLRHGDRVRPAPKAAVEARDNPT